MKGLFLLLALPGLLHAQDTSSLWGRSGENWSPQSRLPDYSYAGYRAGEAPIPNIPVVRNVKTDYGAAGNGVTDDTAAFQTALDTMPAGALHVPAGTYVLSNRLLVSRSGIVIRGAGQGSTTLKFTKSLEELHDTGKLVPDFTVWMYGQGGLLWFGKARGIDVRGAQLATVTAAAQRGDKTLTLSSTSGITPGQYILLELDPPDVSFKRHLYGSSSTIIVKPSPAGMYYRWPVKVVSKSGNQVTLVQPLRSDLQLNWNPQVFGYNFISEVGVESLRFQFPDLPFGPTRQEPGFNALAFWGCINSWARNIDIFASDNPIDVNYMSKHVSLEKIRVLPRSTPNTLGLHGHHGISFTINATDCLLTDFSIEADYSQDVDLSHFANGNVIKNGWGTNFNMAHHMDAPFENLWCNLSLGNPIWWGGGDLPNPYGSGGGAGEAHAASRHTFWNITTNAGRIDPPQNYTDDYASYANDFPWSVLVPSTETRNDEWCFAEQITGSLVPADLHASQLQRRLGGPIVDTMAPQVSITAPTGGSTVSGTLTLSATATDDVGVAGVQFQLDGVNIGSEDTTSPYSISWGSASASNGSHTISARARDAAGNSKTATVTVTVQNTTTDTTLPQVTLTAPTGGVVSSTVTLSATASDNVGVVGVQFQVDGTNVGSEDTTSPYSMSWSSSTVTNG